MDRPYLCPDNTWYHMKYSQLWQGPPDDKIHRHKENYQHCSAQFRTRIHHDILPFGWYLLYLLLDKNILQYTDHS